jgi:hypothetical protein
VSQRRMPDCEAPGRFPGTLCVIDAGDASVLSLLSSVLWKTESRFGAGKPDSLNGAPNISFAKEEK